MTETTKLDKVNPHNTKAEQSVIGAIMISPTETTGIYDTLSPEDFFDPRCGKIYAAMRTLYQAQQPIDAVTLAHQLADDNCMEYAKTILNTVPTAAHAEAYAEIVKQMAVRRQLIKTAEQIAQDAAAATDYSALIEQSEQRIMAVTHDNGAQHDIALSDSISNMLTSIKQASDSLDGITGVPTGFADLDAATAGLQPSDYIVIPARPSMGKTAFALCAGIYACRHGYPTAIFSLEMSTEQLLKRALSLRSGIPHHKLRTGQLTDAEWEQIADYSERMAHWPLTICDSAYSMTDIRRRARAYVQQQGVKLIMIDYLQLIEPGQTYRGSKVNEVAEISRELKLLAKELNTPIVVLSQLNRASETRTDNRPKPSDIRDSGAVEQDADVILFLYRDDYYDPDTDEPGIAEVIIGKQRNGALGTIKLGWDAQHTKFYNLMPN